jgi:hypothetical protein
MDGKSLIEIIDEISADEKRTRGCLDTQIHDARIEGMGEIDEFLIAEFEKETNLRRKWVIALVIRNYHPPAEVFAGAHTHDDGDGNQIFVESPE